VVEHSRRTYLGSIAVALSAGVAGCGGNSGDGSDGSGGSGGGGSGDESGGDGGDGGSASGERVPTILVDYVSDLPGLTEMSERMVPQLQTAMEELGLQMETNPRTFSAWLDSMYQDQRQCHFSVFNYANNPDRLDPDEFTFNYAAVWAGGNGLTNQSNYANCEVQTLCEEQRLATDQEDRREIVYEAHALHSQDVVTVPLIVNASFGAYNEQEVTPGPLGPSGVANTATHTLIQTTANDGEVRANTTPATVETNVHLRFAGPTPLVPWSTIVYSPLFGYDEEYNFINILADSQTVSDDGLEIEIGLKEATFHNGEPVTSEDVRWTFSYLNDNSDVFPRFPDVPIESIDAPDDGTVVFNLSERFAPLVTRVMPEWGVLPRQHFIDNGAEEDPAGFTLDSVVGSGPYTVDNYSQGQSLLLSPHDGHPLYSPESNLALIAYSDSQGAARAFQNGDINWLQTINASLADQVDQNVDAASIEVTESPSNLVLWPQYSWGPTKHRPIRMAVSQAINRQRINQTVALGESTPVLHSTNMSPTHPFYPGEDNLASCADSPQANVETAMSILEEAGFSVDGDGNLRYPADADLSPRWPEGEAPSDYPDRFPCLS
jgi:peptide/nickel transport system substrate-binding protein